MTARRLQRLRVKGWRKPPGAVIVDRTSRWGNPWAVRLDPRTRGWRVVRHRSTRLFGPSFNSRDKAVLRACGHFRRWLRVTPSGRALAERARNELRGKDLVCWCGPHDDCHAEALLDAANRGSA